MNSYDVTFQLVDSPTDQSKPGGTVAADRLIEAFRGFPFAEEVKRAESIKDGATFPTITFRRNSDGEAIAIWTSNAKQFDLCFVHGAGKRFLNHQSKEEVEAILDRFQTESVLVIQPRSFRSRIPITITLAKGGKPGTKLGWRGTLISFAIGGLIMLCFVGPYLFEPTDAPEYVHVQVVAYRTGAGGSQWFTVVALSSGQSWQVGAARGPFVYTYRGPALLDVRRGRWTGKQHLRLLQDPNSAHTPNQALEPTPDRR